jgi:hypothetical protein
MVRGMAKAHNVQLMGQLIKVITKMIIKTEKQNIGGLMEQLIKEIIRMV